VGAVAGAVLGLQNHKVAEGAIVGGVFGAFTGALLSNMSVATVSHGYTYQRKPVYHGYRDFGYAYETPRAIRAQRAHARHEAREAAQLRRAERIHARHEYREHHRGYKINTMCSG